MDFLSDPVHAEFVEYTRDYIQAFLGKKVWHVALTAKTVDNGYYTHRAAVTKYLAKAHPDLLKANLKDAKEGANGKVSDDDFDDDDF